MSRSLILMRHARQSGVAARDHDRPLTDEGREQAFRVGARLAEIGDVPSRALSSTALRCRETMEALTAGIGRPIEADFEPNLYNASAHELLDALALLADLHHRMPVLLQRDTQDEWFNPQASSADLLAFLLAPQNIALQAWPVAKKVNSPVNDYPDLLAPAG